MTIRIESHGDCGVKLTLSCDAPGCAAAQTWTEGHFIQQRHAATQAGWVERQTSAGRQFMCPACARKS